MDRRAFGMAALAAGVVATVLVPFMGAASAATCPSFTDPAGDAVPFKLPANQLTNANLDLVGGALGTVAGDIVATITVNDLLASPAGTGDRFTLQFDIETTKLRLVANREHTGNTATVTNIVSAASGAATATYDATKNTVTIKATQAEVDKAAGKPTKGLTSTVVSASSGMLAGGDERVPYDTANAPAAMTYAIGVACEAGGPAPTGSPTGSASATPSATASATPTASATATPSASATATPTGSATPTPSGSATPGLPAGFPTAGCWTFEDVKGDGKPKVSLGTGPTHELDNDPDLDVLGVAVNTTDTHLKVYFKIDKLAMPKTPGGHIYGIGFKANAKDVWLQIGEGDAAGKAIESEWGTPNYGTIGGSINDGIVVSPTWDKANSWAILSVPLAHLATATAGAFGPGTQLTAVSASSGWMFDPLQDWFDADIIQAAAAGDRVYTVGTSPCWAPPPAVLTNTGATTVQHTDTAAVAAKLTNAAGALLSGKAVTFTLNGVTVSGTTASDGVAKASLNPALAAGTYSLVTAFAGDATASKVTITTPFTVTAEATKLVLTVVKNGTKRTVTAKLTDDDGKAVAGQVVTWYVNGKKVSAPRTNAAGVVTLTTAKPTQTVKAVFAAVTGKYLGSTATRKV